MYSELTWCNTKLHEGLRDQAPCYVFDTDILVDGLRQMKELMPNCQKICYSMKANPFIISYADAAADWFEVCSPGEYEICWRNGIDPEKIIISGVNKTRASMMRIMDLCGGKGIFTAESPLHYHILKEIAQERKLSIRLLLRLTSGNQFGMDEETIHGIFEENRENPWVEIIGIHYFSGTQKKLKKIEKELLNLNDYAARLKQEFHMDALELEYGAGLSVSYFAGDKPIGREEQLVALNEILGKLSNFDRIGVEMGRFIAADCGCLLATVDDLKTTEGKNYVILDTGYHQINYVGQMIGMKHPPILQLPERAEEPEQEYIICGALCTPNDIMARDIHFRNLQIGDHLMFQRCGAYSMTEGIGLFLSRDLPAVFAYSKAHGYQCLRKRIETNPFNSLK